MKILMIAIPNHHFFQWADQLKDLDIDVVWFDITDGGPPVEKMKWLRQIKGWKLRCNYPFRYKIKKIFARFYAFIGKFNERRVSDVFNNLLIQEKPDIIHCFEMLLTGLPILPVLLKHTNIPLYYSSWGSDIYLHKQPEIKKNVKQFLERVDFLISDCERDLKLASELGFKSKFLGVFPGNGGVNFLVDKILPAAHRRTIVIKGYDDGVGKALVVIRALENIKRSHLEPLDIIVYGADIEVVTYVNNSIFFSKLNIQIFPRHAFIPNEEILRLMGKSCIYIGNSNSDGLPNSLIEAMGMGAFPIQSNPGDASAEIIRHGENGFLISNTEDSNHIAELIEKALLDFDIRKKAQAENTSVIGMKYSRSELKQKIINLYHS